MAKVITITAWGPGEHGIGGFGGYDVHAGDMIADGLTLGEMFEQILGLFAPPLRTYSMRTAAEINMQRWADYCPDDPCDGWPYYASGYGEIPF